MWTSLAHESQWCFVLARTEPGSVGHHGLSFLLVPMDQPGIEVQPIQQLTGTSEFNEVFFADAVTAADNIISKPAMAGRWPWPCSASSAGIHPRPADAVQERAG